MIMQVAPTGRQPSPDAKLARLRQIPIDKIREFPAVVVDCKIKDLSAKNTQRVVYVLGSTLIKVRNETEKLVAHFQLVEGNLKKIIENYEGKNSSEIGTEVLNDLKEAISPEHLKKQLEDMEKAHIEALKSKDNQPDLKALKVQIPKSA